MEVFVFHQKTSSQFVISCMALCYFHMLTFTTGKVCNTLRNKKMTDYPATLHKVESQL